MTRHPPKSISVTEERKLGRIALKTDSAQLGPSPFLLSQGISVQPPPRLLSGLLTLTDILFLTAPFQSSGQSRILGPPFPWLYDPILSGPTFLDGLSWWSLSLPSVHFALSNPPAVFCSECRLSHPYLLRWLSQRPASSCLADPRFLQVCVPQAAPTQSQLSVSAPLSGVFLQYL